MEDNRAEKKSLDVLGLKPLAKSAEIATKGLVDGAAALLGRICLPAAKEYGLLLRDVVSGWRKERADEIAARCQEKMMAAKIPDGVHAHPRIVHAIIDQGSWNDDAEVQDLWAGLLASSCTPDGKDESNLIFVNLLSGLTGLEARVLKFACENSHKQATHGLIGASTLVINFKTLQEITREPDIQRLDRELDHLRGLALLSEDSGFNYHDINHIVITPTPLALHMYARCAGSRKDPHEFFNISVPATKYAASPDVQPGSA